MQLMPIPTLEKEDPVERLLEFYHKLGWDSEQTLNPALVRLRPEDHMVLTGEEMRRAREQAPSDPDAGLSVGFLWLNWGPSTCGETPGKVELLPGWVKDEQTA